MISSRLPAAQYDKTSENSTERKNPLKRVQSAQKSVETDAAKGLKLLISSYK